MKILNSFNSVRTAMCSLAKLCLSAASTDLTIVYVGIFYFVIRWQDLPWKVASLLSQTTHLQETIHSSISIVACFIHLHINNVYISRHIYWIQEKPYFQWIRSVFASFIEILCSFSVCVIFIYISVSLPCCHP